MRRRRRNHPGPAGFLLVNKPASQTARNYLDQWLRAIPGKAGMEGVLDPFAEGLLIFGFGNATRYLPYFHDLEKEYVATLQLGSITDTLDTEGSITETQKVPDFSHESKTEGKNFDTLALIQSKLEPLLGEQMQKPPIYSNIKTHGRRAHTLAREGKSIDLKERTVFIHDLQVLNYDTSLQQLHFKAIVSSGTYIRALGRDIALKLGTCGHLITLKRTRIGPFSIEKAIFEDPALLAKENSPDIHKSNEASQALQDKISKAEQNENTKGKALDLMIPLGKFFEFLPDIKVSPTEKTTLQKGGYIERDMPKGMIALYCDREFLGIGISLGKKIKPERLLRGAQ